MSAEDGLELALGVRAIAHGAPIRDANPVPAFVAVLRSSGFGMCGKRAVKRRDYDLVEWNPSSAGQRL